MSDPVNPTLNEQLTMQPSPGSPANDQSTAQPTSPSEQPSGQVYQPLPVPGYTPVPESAVDLVGENKIAEEKVMRTIDSLSKPDATLKCDQRSLALARSYLQTGFMWLNRAIFQPQRVPLPEDEAKAPSGQTTDENAGVPTG